MPPSRAVAGLLLAAGAGSRFGQPKALVRGWLPDRVRALTDGGCDPVVVVLGAAADRARALVPAHARVVVAPGWADGMGESLRAGLDSIDPLHPLGGDDVDAVLVALVDTPGLTSAAVARLVDRAGVPGPADAVLAQATYAGRPGHPVLLGRRHWAGVRAVTAGDRGARDYLAARTVDRVECGDVADGRDVDVPPTRTPQPGPGPTTAAVASSPRDASSPTHAHAASRRSHRA